MKDSIKDIDPNQVIKSDPQMIKEGCAFSGIGIMFLLALLLLAASKIVKYL